MNPLTQPCQTCERFDPLPFGGGGLCSHISGGVQGHWTGCAVWRQGVGADRPPAPQLLAYQTIPAGCSVSTVLPDFDFEAYSEAGYYWDGPTSRWRGISDNGKTHRGGIGEVGAAVYAEHPSTEIISLAYDLKDGNGPHLWTPASPVLPYDLFAHIAIGGLIEAWNSFFEFYLWLRVGHERMGWPVLPHTSVRCAMSKARAFSLPGALGKAAKAIGAQEQKDAAGDALIKKLCVPRTPTKKQVNAMTTIGTPTVVAHQDWALRHANRLTPLTAPQDFSDFYAYNIQDIKAEASMSALCPDLMPRELELWLTDQAINIRGVHIDQKALQDCIAIVRQATEKYTRELQEITCGAIATASELAKIQAWLAGKGVHTPNLDAETVENLLRGDDNWFLPEDCRRVLEIREALGGASVKKLFAIERTMCRDFRLRDLFAFCGADRTGRWAGRGAQPQNMPSSGPGVCRCWHCGHVSWKGLIACPACNQLRGPKDGCDWGIEAVETALIDIATRNLAYVEARWGDACAVVSGVLRGLFSAAPGHDFICSDYSAIEAVVLAELAGEEWRQEVFRTHGKIYEMSASKITGVAFEEFAKYKKETGQHHPLRKKVGKVAELASGYRGWVGAWKAFGADQFMTDEEIEVSVKAWREASPMVCKLWYGLEKAAHLAVSNPGTCYSYQAPATKYGQPPAITYGVKNDVLYCLLPSGRMLSYHRPRLHQVIYFGKQRLALSYMGLDSVTKQWTRIETHGGKLAENTDQAVARDLLAFALPALERTGYPVVLHVHDEIVSEVPEGTGDVAEFERIMSTVPAWATGWPVKAAGGWRGKRYRKE